MDSQLRQLCTAVIADLSGASFDTSLAFTRKTIPRYDLVGTDREGWVLASAERREPDSRSQWSVLYDVQIGVVKKLDSDIADECDVEQRIVEQIADYFDQQRPTGIEMPLAQVVCIPFSQDHLEKFQIYLGVVMLTFQSWRD